MEAILLIDHANLSRLDLNLLVAFDALLTEGSVTRAAERVGIGQPSMSHALGRLRRLLNDELFVRAPDGVRPTPRALALADPIRVALAAIQGTLLQGRASSRPRRSGPSSSACRTASRSPCCRACWRTWRPRRPRSASGSARPTGSTYSSSSTATGCTWASALLTEGAVHHKRRRLYSGDYLCLYDPARLPLAAPLTLEDYVAVPHVLGSPRGDAHGVVDDALAPLGLRRAMAVTTPHFAAVPFL